MPYRTTVKEIENASWVAHLFIPRVAPLNHLPVNFLPMEFGKLAHAFCVRLPAIRFIRAIVFRSHFKKPCNAFVSRPPHCLSLRNLADFREQKSRSNTKCAVFNPKHKRPFDVNAERLAVQPLALFASRLEPMLGGTCSSLSTSSPTAWVHRRREFIPQLHLVAFGISCEDVGFAGHELPALQLPCPGSLEGDDGDANVLGSAQSESKVHHPTLSSCSLWIAFEHDDGTGRPETVTLDCPQNPVWTNIPLLSRISRSAEVLSGLPVVRPSRCNRARLVGRAVLRHKDFIISSTD